MLTFEFSSIESEWLHHLMPLSCPPPPSPSLHSSPSLLHYLPLLPSVFSSLSSLHPSAFPRSPPLLHVSPLAHPWPSVPPSLPLLPDEWQAHKCSNDSGRGVSVTAIEAVTGARAQPGSQCRFCCYSRTALATTDRQTGQSERQAGRKRNEER